MFISLISVFERLRGRNEDYYDTLLYVIAYMVSKSPNQDIFGNSLS